MAENIKSRKYYRVHNGTDWDRMHFVTDANSVDANDGDNMETKVGAFKGITTSTNVTEEGYAADATTVAALNDSLASVYASLNNVMSKLEAAFPKSWSIFDTTLANWSVSSGTMAFNSGNVTITPPTGQSSTVTYNDTITIGAINPMLNYNVTQNRSSPRPFTVQLSTNGGSTWGNVASFSISSSNGNTAGIADLSAYAGKTVKLRIVYDCSGITNSYWAIINALTIV